MNLQSIKPAGLKWLLPLLFLLQTAALQADQLRQGAIRFQAAQQEAVWVGQEVELQLELWTDGFSFADQLFVLPEVNGAFLLQPDSSTIKLDEIRDGVRWQGLRYTLLLYPQREGRLEVPAFNVRFAANAGFGTEQATFNKRTPPLFIEVRLPPGAETGGLLVTTRSFSMDAAWSPRPPGEGPLELKVGDALKLNVERTANDVPGMVFEPLPDFRLAEFGLDGLGVYAETPQVNDRMNRGSLTGGRTDTVTFIAERDGNYDLPELRFQWWDPDSEVMSEQVIPALTLTVTANPAYAETAGGISSRAGRFGDFSPWTWLGVLVVLGVLIFPLRMGWRLLLAYLNSRRVEKEAGEPWAFSRVKKACHAGQPAEAYNAITLWLSRLGSSHPGPQVRGVTLMNLARDSGNAVFVDEARALQECVAAGSTGEWRGRELAQLLVDYRKHAGHLEKNADRLHALNPLT